MDTEQLGDSPTIQQKHDINVGEIPLARKAMLS